MMIDFHDDHFETLDQTQVSPADYELALRHAPRIRFDQYEPFLPSVAGYTVFRRNGQSPSFPREIVLPDRAACAIEYAVWWDWDIQHLYELEHIWVYLDKDEQVVAADASWHGGQNVMVTADGQVPLDDNGRVILYSEPGKHAFAPMIDWLRERESTTRKGCSVHSGKGGVLVTALFNGIIHDRNPANNQLAWTYLEQQQFEPSYEFSQVFELNQAVLVPWANLFEWIPRRVHWWVQQLAQQIPPEKRRVIRIAHRGASGHAQENSLAAIRKAAELGADMVEVDLRLTADQIPVIAHDDNLQRVYGIVGMISDHTWEALNALTPADKEPLATLTDLAKTCRSLGLGIYLDIKQFNFAVIDHIFAELDKNHMLGATIFGSFRADWLAEIKAQRPNAVTSILFSSVHVDPVTQAQAINSDYVHPCWERFEAPHTLLTPDWVASVRSLGIGIVCWHEERPAEIQALQQLGVNAICSDQPELLLPEIS